MNDTEFAAYLREGGNRRLRVDNVKIVTRECTFSAQGELEIAKGRIRLNLVLLSEGEVPQVEGFVGESDFWEISGTIDQTLPFRCKTVPHSHGTLIGNVSLRKVNFETDRIWLPPDTLSHGQMSSLLDQLNDPKNREQIESGTFAMKTDPIEPSEETQYEFLAIIPGVKPVWTKDFTEIVERNRYFPERTHARRDTFVGAAENIEFALIEAGQDLQVHMRYRGGDLASEGVARARFDSLLQAVAFTHGCEPWFHRYTLRRGVQKIEDILTPRQSVPKTIYSGLTERLCHNGADLEKAIVSAMTFFGLSNETTARVATLLRIARQSGASGVPFDLGLLGLCTVFEGLIDTLFKEFGLEETMIQKEIGLREFQEKRGDLLRFIASKNALHNKTWDRLDAILRSASAIRGVEKAQAVSEHLSLPWEPLIKPAFDAWNQQRHAGAHGAYDDEHTEQSLQERFWNQSRIAGAINILVAKRIGYTGKIARSLLEDDYTTI